jgi:fido (protein-threonine AMPylation protein)
MVCLPPSDPLLCPRSEKAARETANTLRQLLYVEELVAMGVSDVRESHVLGFQQLAVDGIYPCAGAYRTLTRTAELEGGEVTHVPPEPAAIQGHVRRALDVMNGLLAESRAEGTNEEHRAALVVRSAAFALWRFNWIHPFAGGNGRTARALAYLVLCIDYGAPIPGRPSMPTLIARRRKAYEAALRAADAADLEGREDLAAMVKLLSATIIEQLRHAVLAATQTQKPRRRPSQDERARATAARKAARNARRKNRR